MQYPDFYNKIETIKLKDELSETLGAFDNGIIEYNYLDVVKAAGHSCPTVAGAYIVTLVGLKRLYKDELPKRGEIKISFKDYSFQGTTGVIANVISQITGATDTYGFKGLNNNFKRYGLMNFNQDIPAPIRLTRLDTKEYVDITYNPNSIPPNPLMQELMQKVLKDTATNEEREEFKKLWQQRVYNIFENINKVVTLEE
ncbi:MAG: hypothetical protein ACQERD_04055 [Campylobacterota bacterium]